MCLCNLDCMWHTCTVKILLNAQAFIINNAFSKEGDGRLWEASLFGNVQLSYIGCEIIGVLDLPQTGLLFIIAIYSDYKRKK